MQREEPQFTMFESPSDFYPTNGLPDKETAFLYFSETNFFAQTGGDIRLSPEEYSLEKIQPFKVFEYKREGKQSIYLIVRVENQEMKETIKYAFFICETNIYPAPTLSGVICNSIDNIMASVIDFYERIQDSVKIDPLKGYIWNGVPVPLEDFTTPLPSQKNFLSERNVAEAINSFLKTNPK
ncbi:hypothetical protein EHI8A_090180 [Entamoeba histolytica HM-1:IMSS-B]|uniref:Mediator of RNA polymerase II transcription subunit 6 n=6 Tax=Entamoeba histolytica TaxID=5759 RepID=B1N3N0_ENTH1|nr:hypothetical protein EHI_030460 [Entamoeba histolytica HM-1:IMSS]EMD49422.1 Hypothetical protein EHI5A_104650 [Entamoeba histolytica KU27]EMH75193.1 hypothetical protein EHI8A_090180 [Entamoeba histolytica HM-1:IMSS-B]EMS17972.1 hypothetical protein KM1_129910 [Entamoeba histolytica HM-3:IMSS]ENY63165.1 hypothetical protein EHI7A_103640 [Entamoeba histolytica HM-1:IMSS-A]GAT96136.1 hypothetical protein CL6EHI_030460 [Entamoeba histolytica]|eukprot:XP_001913796.1 hypothetical protein EHI_030460 [Entamoeba histolytica HM-1:IMSS]